MFPVAPGCPAGIGEGAICLAVPTPVVELADLLSSGIMENSWAFGPSGGLAGGFVVLNINYIVYKH